MPICSAEAWCCSGLFNGAWDRIYFPPVWAIPSTGSFLLPDLIPEEVTFDALGRWVATRWREGLEVTDRVPNRIRGTMETAGPRVPFLSIP